MRTGLPARSRLLPINSSMPINGDPVTFPWAPGASPSGAGGPSGDAPGAAQPLHHHPRPGGSQDGGSPLPLNQQEAGRSSREREKKPAAYWFFPSSLARSRGGEPGAGRPLGTPPPLGRTSEWQVSAFGAKRALPALWFRLLINRSLRL